MKNILKKIAAFQQEVPTILKNKKGYSYQYANLTIIFETINPLMKKHGLGFYQRIINNKLITTIFDPDTGEKMESVMPFIEGVQLKGMNEFQVLGSQITYLRRYSLACMLGLVTDEDRDAEGKQEKKKPKPPEDKIQGIIEAINSGKYTREQFEKKYDLSDLQI
jgi:hypothetical protein